MKYYKPIEDPDEHGSGGGGHNAPLWLIIYTDMITNLMIFFLMCYCLTWLSQEDKRVAAASMEEEFGGKKDVVKTVVQKIEEEKKIAKTAEQLMEDKIKAQFPNVENSEQRIKINLPSAVLFDSGKADLKNDTKTTLHQIAEIIRPSSNTVVVEGYTDDKPIHTKEFESNWELSSTRAFSVIRYLADAEGVDIARLSALGYGEFRAKFKNDSEEHRAGNRRIEISIIKAEKK
jgi:chemotaxis protein MotB